MDDDQNIYPAIEDVLSRTSLVLSSTSKEEVLSHLDSLDIGLSAVMTLEQAYQSKMNLLKNDLGQARLQRKKIEAAKESCKRYFWYLKSQEPREIRVPPMV